MAKDPLQVFKLLFKDNPNILKRFEPSNLSLSQLEDEILIAELRKKELFAEPVNFYLTGRTGAGKTSLANIFLDSKQKPLVGSGLQDCTTFVQYFALYSSMRCFDLPPIGSSEKLENINRAVLLIPQWEDNDITDVVSEFSIADYSGFIESGATETISVSVERWQYSENQRFVAPNIILYLVAPHKQFTRDDKSYLRALLKVQQEYSSKNKIIFIFNIFCSLDGRIYPSSADIQNCQGQIAEIYKKFYSDVPPIVEINALTGNGIKQIFEVVSRLLLHTKIGSLKYFLQHELNFIAKQERSHRYRNALIYLVSRLLILPPDDGDIFELLRDLVITIFEYVENIFSDKFYQNKPKEIRVKSLFVHYLCIATEVVNTETIEEITTVVHEAKEVAEIVGSHLVTKMIMIPKEKHERIVIPGEPLFKCGYRVLEQFLSIGISLENEPNLYKILQDYADEIHEYDDLDEDEVRLPSRLLEDRFNALIQPGIVEVNLKITPIKDKINQLINSKSSHAEVEIRRILQEVLIH